MAVRKVTPLPSILPDPSCVCTCTNKRLCNESRIGVFLWISVEIATGTGVNLELCAGNADDFASGACPTRLGDSGGPGFKFLTIVDAASLNGKVLYVIRAVGVNSASFRFTIE